MGVDCSSIFLIIKTMFKFPLDWSWDQCLASPVLLCNEWVFFVNSVCLTIKNGSYINFFNNPSKRKEKHLRKG